jgi:xanthosine utilization system XapX-like protein
LNEPLAKPDWFVVGPGRKPFGPYTLAKLRTYARNGRLTPASLVWRKGMRAWVRAEEVPGVFVGEDVAAARAPSSAPTPAAMAPRAKSAPRANAVLAGSPPAVSPSGASPLDALARWGSTVGGIASMTVMAFVVVQSVRSAGALVSIIPIALAFVGLVSIPLGGEFMRVGQRLVRNCPVRASNRAIFVLFGMLALAAAIIVAVASGIWASQTGDVVPLVTGGTAVCMLGVYAFHSAFPSLIGVEVDPSGTMGEDSIALWGAPFRIALASAGLATALVQLLCAIGGTVGLVMALRAGDAAAFDARPGAALATWCAGCALAAGFAPVVIYLATMTQFLLLGTVESIQAVGRHVREQKREGRGT